MLRQRRHIRYSIIEGTVESDTERSDDSSNAECPTSLIGPPPSRAVKDDQDEKESADVDVNRLTTPHPVDVDQLAGHMFDPMVDRSDEVQETDCCVMNVENLYVQAKEDDNSLIVSSANFVWSRWTIIDSQISDVIYFRDNKGRYITSDGSGRVFMAFKSDDAKWTRIRTGCCLRFQDVHGLFLTASYHGGVTCHALNGAHAALFTGSPVSESNSLVTEGLLRKKGRWRMSKWHNRYFECNHATMRYWERKEDASHWLASKRLYRVTNIASVSMDTMGNTKFFIHFKDGQSDIHLDAINTAECLKWLRSFEKWGINIMQNTTANTDKM